MLDRFLRFSLATKAALIIACISLINGAALITWTDRGTSQIIKQNTALLGNNLSQQLARDASNLLVQGDKLRLQSLLNELVLSPEITRGAIYDIDNHPITEAGDVSAPGQAYSASITFQDSLAGYAVIVIHSNSLQQSADALWWQMIGLNILLALLAGFFITMPTRYLVAALKDLTVISQKPLHLRPRNLHLSYRGEDELQQLATQIIKGPSETNSASTNQTGAHAAMHLDLFNLPALRESQIPKQIDQLLSQCYQQLATICKLYDGELNVSGSHRFSAIFHSNDQHDHPFRAICSAYLISKLLEKTASGLHSAASVAHSQQQPPQSANTTLNNQLWQQQTIEQAQRLAASLNDEQLSVEKGLSGQLIIDQACYQSDSVEPRVNLHSEANSVLMVNSFNDPYQALLAKQLTALNSQF